MSFSGDYYFGDWNAPPSLALDNGYGDGYGNGDGDGGWDFAGNPGPDDGFNWDDWVTGNLPDYNSIADDSANGTSVVDNSFIDNSIPGNTLNPTIGTSATGKENSIIDNAVIDNPVIGNSIPRNTLNPAIGTSATGNWIPGNSVTDNWAIGNWITGSSVTGNPARSNLAAGNPAIGTSATGNWIPGNSATSNLATGNSATSNWVVGNSVTNNLATANQFVVNPVVGNPVASNPVVVTSVTGNPATTNAPSPFALRAAQRKQRRKQRAMAAARAQAVAQIQAQAAAQRQMAIFAAQAPAAAQQLRAIAAAQAQAAAQIAAGQVPAAAAASTFSGAASSSFAPHPFVGVPSTLNHQPMSNAVTGNVVTGNPAVSITAPPAPAKAKPKPKKAKAPAPIPSRPLLPHEIFPFTKLPQELQLIIYRYVWHTVPDTPPSGQSSYQQHLQFYSSPRHLRAQLRDLFKLGAISPAIRNVAYPEYFRSTQLYLRYDSFFRWNYSDSWHGSDQLTNSMNLLWQDATLSPLLVEYVEHVAWHIAPVYHRELCNTERAALKWLTNCKNMKTLEIVVGMRSTHVRPKDLRDLLNARAKFANGVPYETFKFFRFFQWSINRLDVLRRTGSLEKVVFSVEPFVNESWRVAEQGTIDLEAVLERSEWWTKFKRDTLKNLLGPKKRKLDPKSEKIEERSFYKIEQHLGHVNPCWHRSYKI